MPSVSRISGACFLHLKSQVKNAIQLEGYFQNIGYLIREYLIPVREISLEAHAR